MPPKTRNPVAAASAKKKAPAAKKKAPAANKKAPVTPVMRGGNSGFTPVDQSNQYVSGIPFTASGTPYGMSSILSSVTPSTIVTPGNYTVDYASGLAKVGAPFSLSGEPTTGGGMRRRSSKLNAR
jgi:hypothetical protein